MNKVLSTTDHLDYLFLKDAAKRIGFKYVWHRSGRFLVIWREGKRPRAIKLHCDLSAILPSIKSVIETLGALQPPAQILSTHSVSTERNTTWLWTSGSEHELQSALKVAILNATSLKKHRWQFRQALSTQDCVKC